MSRLLRPLILVLLAAFAVLAACSGEPSAPPATHGHVDWLPAEAVDTLALIERGGPFPYTKDGAPFFNRERRLPDKPRGYYREYTVPTPGEPTRGARRIVAGGNPPEVYYYTADHYRSFRRIPEAR